MLQKKYKTHEYKFENKKEMKKIIFKKEGFTKYDYLNIIQKLNFEEQATDDNMKSIINDIKKTKK